MRDSGTEKIAFSHIFSGANGRWATPDNSISFDIWHHVVVVYDDSLVSNNPVIYIDGISQTITELETPTGTRNSDAGTDFLIGNRANQERTFDGSIAEVAIYDVILSAAEAKALSHTINPLHIRRTNLKGYWPILGHTSPEADLSGNKNNGTVTGAVKSGHPPITPYQIPFSPRTVA